MDATRAALVVLFAAALALALVPGVEAREPPPQCSFAPCGPPDPEPIKQFACRAIHFGDLNDEICGFP